ncbi:MAG: dihydroorotate dehydrogenase electron transfer subunit [Bacteroidales bacterium]|nr:dihydroorotate dehydrogenase electron transfer subunit [Bacteroidales bacterium]
MKKIQDFNVYANHRLNSDTFILELKAPEKLPEIFPGQFAQLKINNHPQVFLRRPFSIHNVDYEKNTISFFIKIIGEGTRSLQKLNKKNNINVIYPLGNYFNLPKQNNVLLVGGGTGVAPLLLLSKSLKNNNISPVILIGGRSKNDILQIKEFEKYCKVLITTEDGNLGEKGLVTQHSVFQTDKFPFKKIYACGPELMMKAIGKFAKKNNIECEVSLENTMACGFGACLCCVVETREGNKCVCTEGPVFNIKDLKWQI